MLIMNIDIQCRIILKENISIDEQLEEKQQKLQMKSEKSDGKRGTYFTEFNKIEQLQFLKKNDYLRIKILN